MKLIKTVTILGANGTMGANCAGIIAGFGGARVFMISRDLDKSQFGIKTAIESIKSDSIASQLVPKTYDDLATCISQSDWVLETATENIDLKHHLNQQIAKHLLPNTIVSTVSSGLSITELAQDFYPEQRPYYFGTHFFNPPYKMLLCELIPHPQSHQQVQKELNSYLQNVLHRQVIVTTDHPGFAGNRIGFQFLNESLQFAQKYQSIGGIAIIDKLLSGFIGHTLPPIATIDLVGLDIHKAIVENIYQLTNDSAHDTFKLPACVDYLISQNHLGNKTGAGFYKKENDQKLVFNIDKKAYEPVPLFHFDFINLAQEMISEGKYIDAFKIIMSDQSIEASITKHFLKRYINYSSSLIGSVVNSQSDIDKAMAYGFNWLPPSALNFLINFQYPGSEFYSFIKSN